MRAHRHLAILAAALLLGGCDGLLSEANSNDPTNLAYSITTETSTGTARGVLLTWDAPRAREAWSYSVYGRTSTSGQWYLVGVTTSTTFHDAGAPQRQYYVAARDQDDYEFGRSRIVTIELPAPLPTPLGLTSISLNGAVHLAWASNAQDAGPTRFLHYRVYSTSYSAASGCAVTQWQLAGTTGAPTFLAGGLTNGVTRCFAVSAVSRDGAESSPSHSRMDTPRHDARHVTVDAFDARPASSGFIFHAAAGGAFGQVVDGTRTDIDFRVERESDGTFWLRTARDDVRIAVHGNAPVADLTSVDVAPPSGYTALAVEARPGFAYIFRMARSDGTRYGVVRIAYVTDAAVVFDWAYQSAAGNPELLRIAP